MIAKIAKLRHNLKLSRTETAILYLIKRGVSLKEELQKETKMSDSELERILEKLHLEGYIEYGTPIQLKVRGFEYLLGADSDEYTEESEGIWLHYHVGKHLLPGEEILASCTDRKSKARFYATNKRMIRVKNSIFGESFHDISYSEITSIVVSTTRSGRLLAASSSASTLLSLFIISAVYGEIYIPALLLFGFLTFTLLIAYYFRKGKRYEFKGPGILKDSSYSNKWTINSEGRDVQKFVKVVRRMLDERNL